ncbi:helix-turn-helix domain-containing protein [Stutzerimonas stutzeri]|uniref:helix-turn-helix domain-containing protein n=1 Tax=Stutzerimonas stutzeri TaxID=316 RepID=UPI00210BAF53|nr:helix-turn-helix domain-containing protein [Stutzerimonas stutzeri]MCQ4321812.1 hypothetical protein [Stutzerimonas stutzeri]
MRNALRTLIALAEDGSIGGADVEAVLPAYPPSMMHEPSQDPLGQAEREALLAVLDARQWDVSRAAQQLVISRNTLYRKLRKHGIPRS